MIKLENFEVMGWEHAIRGMRNPMNSWEKSDSMRCGSGDCDICIDYDTCPFNHDPNLFIIGDADENLMRKLRNAGTDHRKFMRMITVYVDVTAPLYWWKEFDTYKVGTVANSCSTMHKIHAKEFTLDDFSHERLTDGSINLLKNVIEELNKWRRWYNRYGTLSEDNREFTNGTISCAKDIWYQMIQLLPSSYNQKRTIMLNYEVLANIYKSRKNHKLQEWRDLCEWIEELPYSELIIGEPDRSETSFQEDLDFFVNDCTKAQLRALYERVGEKLKEGKTNA